MSARSNDKVPYWGCGSQTFTPSSVAIEPGEICLLPDASNRKVAYNCTKLALMGKGFHVKEVNSSQTSGCPLVLEVQTLSKWDMANFTKEIHYRLYKD